MKRLITKSMVPVLLCLLVFTGMATAQVDSLANRAIDRLAASVLNDVPEDLPVSRIVVLPMKGDVDDAVRSAVERDLVQRPEFTLLERSDVEYVQSEALNAFVNPATVADIAQALGAQAVLLGDIHTLQSYGWFTGKARVHADLKIVDISTLTILWADNYDISATTWWGRTRWYIISLVLFIIVVAYLLARGGVSDRKKILDKADKERYKAVELMKTAEARSLKDALYGSKKGFSTEMANQIRTLQTEVEQLNIRVKSTGLGDPKTLTMGEVKDILKKAESLGKQAKLINEIASNIQLNAGQDDNFLADPVNRLRTAISKARDAI